jgi:branched-chain amino acid transport system ATP-binding protein
MPADTTYGSRKEAAVAALAGVEHTPGSKKPDPIVVADGIVRRFGGLTAVNVGHVEIQRGAITALIGPNGAGKTTFFNLLTKFLHPTTGNIVFNGTDITTEQPAQTARRGIVRSFQISAVFPHMSVLENVRAALQRNLGTSFHFWKSEASLFHLHERARQLLAEVDLQDFASELTVNLPYGRKRALELATTLALEPELMLLDEPTQGMGHEDVDRVTQLIKKVSAGRTILMVEHNMNVVSSIADRITVLQRGAIIADGPYADVSKNPLVIEAYMGTVNTELQGAH